jgi:Putative Ig domain
MFSPVRSMLLISVLAVSPLAVAQSSSQNAPAKLEIQAKSLPAAMTGQRYSARVSTTGGAGRISWGMVGKLPPGLQLNPRTGEITGVPRAPGEWRFSVQVGDENLPPQMVRREMVLQVIPSLLIVWMEYPQVQNGGIFGKVAVSNNTDQDFDLTVIIVAVNEIGRATALGYQHFALRNGVVDFEIPFGTTLPAGYYVVHADAVAEVAPQNAIYRSRVQTPLPVPLAPPL